VRTVVAEGFTARVARGRSLRREDVLVVVADLVAHVPEHRAVRLAELLAALLVGFGEIQ
jgi:hypothetical protein